MPALTMAYRIGEKAGGVGFDWGKSSDALDKVAEELGEVRDVITSPDEDRYERLSSEIGDLLFAVASMARLEGIDPEMALRRALTKFRHRFELMEEELTSDGRKFDDYTLDEMEAVWQRIKQRP